MMNHLSQYRNSPITPHSHQSAAPHFSSSSAANCLQGFAPTSRFSPHNFMERVMQIPNDLSRYQVGGSFETQRLETLSEIDKIQTMNSGNCYKTSPPGSTSGSVCTNGVLCTERNSNNYLSASNLIGSSSRDIRDESNHSNLMSNASTITSSSAQTVTKSNNCNDGFKIPTTVSASTSTSPLVIAKCMIDVSTMTDPLTVEEQERLGQWEGFAAVQSGNKVAEYLTSLRQFLKVSVFYFENHFFLFSLKAHNNKTGR